ncbi:MAG: NADP-dependent oxidoreductase [Candidatus Hodarchaeales archaeon]
MTQLINRQWRLKSHPVGYIKETDFEWLEELVPELQEGELLIRNIYLSLDPANRSWVNPSRVSHYVKPVGLGDVMRGITIGVVEKTRNTKYEVGAIVSGLLGWQDYAISNGRGLSNLSLLLKSADVPLSAFLNIFGMIGLTAYFGLLDIGQPKEGETLVVSAAAGAVGSLVGQLGKIIGCRVIGIAGTAEKCDWLLNTLGFDGAINYKKESVYESVKKLCPDGVDIYFDNVGGEILDAVLGNIALHGRIIICGMISMYNATKSVAGPSNFAKTITKRVKIQGFIVSDYFKRTIEALPDLFNWFNEGKLIYREDIVEGLENAPIVINRLFNGTNKGKLIIKISEEPMSSKS